jgi:hypothetical protein
MKIKILSIFAIVAMLLVNACKGPEGPVGPVGSTGTAGVNGTNGAIGSTGTAGANGTNGTNGKDGGTGATGATGSTGAAGANGKDGNANVVYSEWKAIKTDKVRGSSKDSKGNYTFLSLEALDKKEPLFTTLAINTAAIYTYIKFNSLEYNQTTNVYELNERISILSPNGNNNYYLLDGRNKENYESYQYVYTNNPVMGENYFSITLYANFQHYDNVSKYIPTPELFGKSLAYFQDVAKTFQIRHVVVYGSTKGRLASVNMKDYDEVKKAFNLKD